MNIDLKNVVYSYPVRRGNPQPALNGVSLGISKGESVGIIGPEGSGKSTLLLLMKGLLQAERGTVQVGGLDVRSRGAGGKALRKMIGLGFQFPSDQFIGETVREEMLSGLADQSATGLAECLEAHGLEADRYLDRSPFRLSMGEGRRVVFSSLLMRRPEVLLLDEPTVGLDGHGLRSLARMLHQESGRGVTIVLVSHDLDFLAEHAGRIYGLAEGRVVIEGPVARVLSNEEDLKKIGYELPEISRIHKQWWNSGEIPEGKILGYRELRVRIKHAEGKGRAGR